MQNALKVPSCSARLVAFLLFAAPRANIFKAWPPKACGCIVR